MVKAWANVRVQGIQISTNVYCLTPSTFLAVDRLDANGLSKLHCTAMCVIGVLTLDKKGATKS